MDSASPPRLSACIETRSSSKRSVALVAASIDKSS
jgi:hypothetical protein